jgi:predicted phosphate transport protein (TIGR00153 family)
MKVGAKEKPGVRDLFYEDSRVLKEAFKSTANAIRAYIDEDTEGIKKYIAETIQLEKAQDKLREEITERIFSKETMVFAREDRLNLIDEMDNVVDLAEIIVRKLSQFNPNIPNEFLEGFKTMADGLEEIGVEVDHLINAILKDFSKGKEIITKITDIRRGIRETRWNLLSQTYQLKFEYIEFHFFQTFIKAMSNAADAAEAMADEIYALICKYSL